MFYGSFITVAHPEQSPKQKTRRYLQGTLLRAKRIDLIGAQDRLEYPLLPTLIPLARSVTYVLYKSNAASIISYL